MRRGIVILVILMLVVAGIIYFSNKNSTTEYNLTEKFGISGNVVSSGIYNEYQNYTELLWEFNKAYVESKAEGKKVYLIFGDNKEINLANYEEVLLGKINLFVGSTNSNLNIKKEEYVVNFIKPEGNNVRFSINSKLYEFKLKPDEKVYLIIKEV